LGCSALGQTSTFYENNGLFQAPPAIPPNIDAVNFLNSGRFIINFNNNGHNHNNNITTNKLTNTYSTSTCPPASPASTSPRSSTG